MKIKFVTLLSILLLANSVSVLAQSRKSSVPQKIEEKVIQLEILDQANHDFEKGLPEPSIIPQNRSDELAAKVAKQLSKYDEDSLPYLMATLQKTGFYIIAENQKILYKPTVHQNGMGLAFYDFEVVGMLKLSRSGFVTSVDKLATVISKDLPEPNKQNFGKFMLEDLRAAANLPAEATGANLTKRFWARLIIELGKQFPTPVDLMTATPENAQLNIIQASLWTKRLIGDLIAAATEQSAMNYQPFIPKQNLFNPRHREERYLNAAYETVALDPCNYADEETTEMDGAATLLTTIHGKILDMFVKQSGDTKLIGSMTGLEKLGAGLGRANLALSWAKLVAAVSQMKGTIKVEDPMPLIRTKSNNTAGERRLLTGHFEIKINNLRQLNCVRTTLNMTTGLDFSMPSSGPLSEKPVSWELGGEVSFAGQQTSKTGVFDQVVYLDPVDGANRDHHKQETDANGDSKIYLEGGKQKRDLNKEPVVPLAKKATIRVDVALKNMKDSKQELADIGSLTIGVATGGGILGIISALPEIGFRTKIPVAAVKIPIRDWQPCSDDWGGTINYKRQVEKTIVVKANRSSNGNSTGDGVRTISKIDEASITLNPRLPEEMKTKPPNPAQIFARGKHSDIFEGSREADPCCGPAEGSFSTKFRSGSIGTYSQIVDRIVTIEFRGTERDYSLGFELFTDQMKYRKNSFYEVLSTSCPLEAEQAGSQEGETTFFLQEALPSGRYGQRFANSAGDVLRGTKVLNNPDGAVETWEWELARCKS